MVTIANADEDAEKLDLSYVAHGNGEWQSFAVSYRTKHMITMQSSICIPGRLCQRNEDLSSYKNLYRNVHSRCICNSPKLEIV